MRDMAILAVDGRKKFSPNAFENTCDRLRTKETRVVKQLVLRGVPAFAPSPKDASDAVVTACPSEAEAIRICIDYAKESRGMSLRAVANLCGWKSPSFLSEVASEASGKRMPAKRVHLFTLATGCRLLEQYIDRQETVRRLTGKETVRDRRHAAVALLMRDAA